ncbi:MAG: hypothetical protein ACYDHO_05815 [Gaiellaceae bacterium]
MSARVYGVLSLVAFAGAVVVAALAGWRESAALGIAYAAIATVSLLVTVAIFCTKCSARDRCGHVVLGPIARLMRKELRMGPYTGAELALTSIALVLIFLLPLGWLWRFPLALGAFGLLLLLGSIDVRARVCPACANAACPLARAGS